MNKTELTSVVAAATGYQKKDVEAVINSVFDNITAALVKEEEVKISGFGKFEVRKRAARKGFNPQTKEEIQIPESKSPAFKAVKALKDRIKQ